MGCSYDRSMAEEASSRSRVRAVVQVIGFALSIVALGWAVRMALREGNRAQLERLLEAGPLQILTMVALAAASVGVNGLIFWVLIRPVRALRATDVISVNAIATLLAYLPFKLSLVARVAIHRKRDGIAILTIGAWLAAAGVAMLAALGPMALASVWLKEIDALWISTIALGVGAALGLTILVSRALAGERGLRRVRAVPLGSVITRTAWYEQLHEGFAMLACWRASSLAALLRVVDVLLFAGRFVAAAWILGLPIGWSDAVLLGSGYFLLGALSPFGALGPREIGTVGIAALVGVGAAEQGDGSAGPIATAVVFITAVEAVVNTACAGFGVAWLRADRMIRRAGESGGEGEEEGEGQ